VLVAATSFMEMLDATILKAARPRVTETMGASAGDLDVGVSIHSLALPPKEQVGPAER